MSEGADWRMLANSILADPKSKIFERKLADGLILFMDRNTKLEARLAATREALEPFAKAADEFHHILVEDGLKLLDTDNLTIGNLRRAKAVYEDKDYDST